MLPTLIPFGARVVDPLLGFAFALAFRLGVRRLDLVQRRVEELLLELDRVVDEDGVADLEFLRGARFEPTREREVLDLVRDAVVTGCALRRRFALVVRRRKTARLVRWRCGPFVCERHAPGDVTGRWQTFGFARPDAIDSLSSATLASPDHARDQVSQVVPVRQGHALRARRFGPTRTPRTPPLDPIPHRHTEQGRFTVQRVVGRG